MIIAYIDPGTGSMLISATIALFSVGFFMLKGIIYRKFSLGGDKGEILDPNKKYGLVFYSEGRQYWNVFKPLVEECSNRGIPATYLSSDKEDPGLNANLEGIEAVFIGTGREAYFKLNRLNADLVVLTTPGLDVLEIKRSKNVKHYTHITHSAGSIAGYKAYATDYFDSVLVGGEGDASIVREMEKKRGLPAKEVEIIGHTYLDILRAERGNTDFNYWMFEEKRPTILLSPTWGNHGLLTKYGHQILEKLSEVDEYNIIIRPHPQSFTSDAELMADLMKKYPNSKNRIWNRDVDNLQAMEHADIMISDFSGIIFDFYALFKKPILTFKSQFEKRGRDAIDLDDEPWDFEILDIIGRTLGDEDVKKLPEIINLTINNEPEAALSRQASVISDKYPTESRQRGVDFIENKLRQLETVSNKLEPNELDTLLNDEGTFNNYATNSNESLLIRFLKAFFNPNNILQLTIGSALLVVYSYIGKRTLPVDGLNQKFIIWLIPTMIYVAATLGIVFMLSTWFVNKGTTLFKKKAEKIELTDFLLVALPLTPIIQYIIANQDILSLSASLQVFGTFTLISVIAVVMLPWLFSTIAAKTVTVPVTLAFLFIIFNMASFGKVTSFDTISAILAGLIVIIYFMMFFKKKNILIIVSLIFFITSSVTSVMKGNDGKISANTETDYNTLISNFTEGKQVKHKPDVFLIIYDSYENEETMDLYGIDNKDQYDYLLNQGFSIYDGTYSVGSYSLASMAHVLNPQRIPQSTEEFRRMLAGDGSAVQEFRKNGYVTHSIHSSDYMTKDFETKYNYSFPDDHSSIPSQDIITRAILEGEFRFDADFSDVDYDDYLAQRKRVLSQKLKEPEFLYNHDNLPGHTQNSGVLGPEDFELHIKSLRIANNQMRGDIEALDLPGRDAIVIIAGDHGPYLTKNGIGLGGHFDISEVNRLDVQDRFGTFLAISWPDKATATRFNIQTIQDVFPAVLSYMYDDDALYEQIRMEPNILYPDTVSGVMVENGIINGGIDDGKPLFLRRGVRTKGID